MLYALIPISQTLMLVLGFQLGFFVAGGFSGVGACLSELLPSRVRGSGLGFIYNFGRGMSAFTPLLVGTLSDSIGPARAIGMVAALAFVTVIAMVSLLPETRGRELAIFD